MANTHHLRRWVGSGRLEGDPSARLRAVLGCTDPETLSEALRDSSLDVARAAIRRLVEVEGTAAAGRLREVLFDADVALVSDLAKALRELHDHETVSIARASLDDERYTHRLAGVITLGLADDLSARPDLCRALDDPVAAVRAGAVQALVRLGPDPDCAVAAAGLLSDESPQVRAAAVRLVAGRHPDFPRLLSAMVNDTDLLVRCELAKHVGELSDESAGVLWSDVDEGVRCQAARCAGQQHASVLARLLREDRSTTVRRAAARSLGLIGGQEAAEALIAGVEDRDAIVRASVLHALERALTRQGAIARLVTELESARASRRRACLHALARLGDRDRAVLVWSLADDPDLDVRLAVLETATAFLPEPDPLLMYMRTDPNLEVRESAERRLAERGS